jgi:hypothetical protein
VVAVPERDGLGTGEAYGATRVDVVERSREGDDSDAGHPSTRTW